jgi:hypothetical protein
MNVTGQIGNAYLLNKGGFGSTDQDLILIMEYGLTIEKKFQVDLRLLMEMIILLLLKGLTLMEYGIIQF